MSSNSDIRKENMIDFSKKFDLEKVGIVKHAELTPEKKALIMNDRSITFGEFDRQANALAHALIKLGIKPGDRVSALMHNSPEILIAWAAAGKVGATPIAMNYRFKADEMAYIINDSESRLFIYGSEFQGIVDTAKPKLEVADLKFVRSGGSSTPATPDLETLIAENPHSPPEVAIDAHGVSSSLVYTSGTTGRPKGVFRKRKTRLTSLLGYAYTFESGHDDTHLVVGPLYHAGPYAWAQMSLILGNTVVIMPRFDAEEFLRLSQEHKITTTWAVPTMLNRIVNLPDRVKNKYDTSSFKAMVVGGEAFPFPLIKKSVEFFGEGILFEFFGATENSCVTYMRPEDQLRKPGSCGKAAFGNDIKLLDENMKEVPQGEVGVMYTKSDFLLEGYYKKPEATAACYHDGYFTVGDMARVDEEGFYYIVDRAVDMVISGGVNIYPAEIEEVLYSHPDVFDAAIIGVPDADWGEKLIAFVVLKEKDAIGGKEIVSYIEERMASYKKPKEVYFPEELPYSPSGKLLKRIIKEEYEKQHPQQ